MKVMLCIVFECVVALRKVGRQTVDAGQAVPVLGATATSWRGAWEKKAAPNHRGTTRAHPALMGTDEEGITAPWGQEKGKGLCMTWGFLANSFWE